MIFLSPIRNIIEKIMILTVTITTKGERIASRTDLFFIERRLKNNINKKGGRLIAVIQNRIAAFVILGLSEIMAESPSIMSALGI